MENYNNLKVAELKAELIKRDQDIVKLNKLIDVKNQELQKPNVEVAENAKLKALNSELAANLNSLISDLKNYLQLQTSSTEVMNSSLDKTIALLKQVR